MAPDATDEDIAAVVAKVEEVGGEAFVSRGLVRTIIGLVGDIDKFHHLNPVSYTHLTLPTIYSV